MAQASSEQPSGWETAGLHPCFVHHGNRWHEPYLFRASHKPTLAFLTEALLLLHTMHWSADPNHFTISPINSSPRLTHESLPIKLREPLVLREIFHSARLHGQPLHCFVLQEVLNQVAAVRLDGRPRRLCLWLFVSLGPTLCHAVSCHIRIHQVRFEFTSGWEQAVLPLPRGCVCKSTYLHARSTSMRRAQTHVDQHQHRSSIWQASHACHVWFPTGSSATETALSRFLSKAEPFGGPREIA